MKNGILWLLASAVLVSPAASARSDHPELTAADQAYSAENFEMAARLYRRDAELGVVAAQLNLAFMYIEGLGVPQDPAQAAQWFQRAADLGNAEAQQNLGVLYRDGSGVAQSDVEAVKWFRIAGAESDAGAVEKRMKPEQVADANRLAAEWRSKHGKATRH